MFRELHVLVDVSFSFGLIQSSEKSTPPGKGATAIQATWLPEDRHIFPGIPNPWPPLGILGCLEIERSHAQPEALDTLHSGLFSSDRGGGGVWIATRFSQQAMGRGDGWTVPRYRTFTGLTGVRVRGEGREHGRQWDPGSKMSCTAPLTSVVTLFKAIDVGGPGRVPGNDMRHSFPAVPEEPPISSAEAKAGTS